MADSDAASARERFAALAARDDAGLDLEDGALLIAEEEYPGLDRAAVTGELDALGREAAGRLAGASDAGARLERLLRFLCDEAGFAGAREDYHDPRNSYLNDVLERRRGIPITLSLVAMAVGRRAGLEARGVSFPGHFLVKCAGRGREWIGDAFAGRLVSREECGTRLAAVLGARVRLRPEVHLRAATPREILVRMLANLTRVFAERGDAERLLACCDRIVLLRPADPLPRCERAGVYERLGWLAAAAADLEEALALARDPELAASLRARRDALRARQGPLH